VPMSARADGISYEDLCLQLLAGAALDLRKPVVARVPGAAASAAQGGPQP